MLRLKEYMRVGVESLKIDDGTEFCIGVEERGMTGAEGEGLAMVCE